MKQLINETSVILSGINGYVAERRDGVARRFLRLDCIDLGEPRGTPLFQIDAMELCNYEGALCTVVTISVRDAIP